MGKAGVVDGEEHPVPAAVTATAADSPRGLLRRCRCRGRVGISLRCVLGLVLGVGVLLSAVFWLPVFRGRDHGDLDLDPLFRDHDIVASFVVKKPVPLLEDNILRLASDIFDEIGAPTTKVDIITLKALAGSNTTEVVFGVDPDDKKSGISSPVKSLIKSSFASLVIRQTSLSLTTSLFGDPFSFDVLKFVGGITVSPLQSAFPLQKVQISFNFTLNFSIDEIQEDFNELTRQLKSGLHLAPYENLYISLTNPRGSTVAPPTTVQSSVLLAVGNTPSLERLKQLAQTIKGSHSKNLGLNNTEFGRVKEVRLSSILQHSLTNGNNAGATSPSPAPLPHHYHQHHHHHHHYDVHLPPAIPPAPKGERDSPRLPLGPTSAPQASHHAMPPDCHFAHRYRFPRKHLHLIPPVAQPISPPYSAPSPQLKVHPPAPLTHLIPVSSPLPDVAYAPTKPPPESGVDPEPPDLAPSALPLQSSSNAGLPLTYFWVITLLLALNF